MQKSCGTLCPALKEHPDTSPTQAPAIPTPENGVEPSLPQAWVSPAPTLLASFLDFKRTKGVASLSHAGFGSCSPFLGLQGWRSRLCGYCIGTKESGGRGVGGESMPLSVAGQGSPHPCLLLPSGCTSYVPRTDIAPLPGVPSFCSLQCILSWHK
jgi:hypothetical protein